MKLSNKTLGEKIKNRYWIWRPILLFLVIGFVVYIIISNSADTKRSLSILRSKEVITKVEVKIGSDSPAAYITLLDPAQLDSINHAFQLAQEKEIHIGGSYDIWAELNVYKGGQRVNLFVQHNAYNGWMIVVGNVTLTSDYLFRLVKWYAADHEAF
ncbi:MAG: hypothetical protein ACXVBX_14685 [Flavisolibacter sp.]